MLASTYRSYTLVAILCALIFVGVLPNVVFSQKQVKTSQNSAETTIVANSTTSLPLVNTAPKVSESTASLLNLYPVEGVPGGDAVVGDFVVGPGKIDLTINPGETKVVEMTVTNRTGEQRQFNLTVEDTEGSQDATKSIVLLGDDRGPYSIKDFISVPYKSFILEHNQRARIPITITLPANAEPGGLYGSVLVNTLAVKAKEGDTSGTAPQSAIIARIGTLFFVTVPGAVEKAGQLSHFGTVPEKTFFQGGPINFGLLFENTGSMHLAPYGELRITNAFGEEVGYVELDPWFVFPKSIRLREVAWNRDFLFGYYKATAYVNRSYDDKIDTLSFSFWVLPWKIMLAGFAGLFIILFIIRTFFKSFEFKRKR